MSFRTVHLLLFLCAVSLCPLRAEELSFSTVAGTSLSEYIPFPFFERTVDEELDAGPLLQPASELFASSDNAIDDEVGETAPEPMSVLRPRYQMSGRQPQQKSRVKHASGELARKNIVSQNPMDASSPSESVLQRSRNVATSGHVINNAHTCNDLACGGVGACDRAGTCGSGKGGNLFRHLGTIKRGRGYCDACGIMTCSTKTFNRWFVDGWVTLGSTMNFDWPDSEENLRLRYNDRNGEPVMNQLYLSFGRNIDKRRNKFDFGGRIDILYGTDYFATSSLNLETRDVLSSSQEHITLDPYQAALHWNSNNGPRRGNSAALYGLSLPQAYTEAFIPLHFGTTIRAGHFYSGMGLESAMSPKNFFYSHSYSFMYGSPTTLTGTTATTQWTKRLSTIVGVTQGWNVFDNPMDRVNWLGGVQWETLDKETALSFIVHTGKESSRPGDIRTGYVLTLNQLLTKRLRYAAEHTLGYEDNGKRIDIFGDRGPARWFSVAQYLQWELNDQWAFGVRGEWFRDDGYSRILGQAVKQLNYFTSGKDLFEVTFGVNWKPTRFITVRPELRYDWANIRDRYNNGTVTGIFDGNREMFSFAIDAVVRF